MHERRNRLRRGISRYRLFAALAVALAGALTTLPAQGETTGEPKTSRQVTVHVLPGHLIGADHPDIISHGDGMAELIAPAQSRFDHLESAVFETP